MAKTPKTFKPVAKATTTTSYVSAPKVECCDGANEKHLASILTAWDQWHTSDKNRNEFTVLTKAIEDARGASKIGGRVNTAKSVNRV